VSHLSRRLSRESWPTDKILLAEIAALRVRLDPELNPDLAPFDTGRAFALYEKIVGRRECPCAVCRNRRPHPEGQAGPSPSWGGLSAREGIEFLRGLVGLDIIAVDVNTVSPPHDVRNVTAFLAAQVIYESLVLLCQKPS
jgi:Arginase family